MLRFSANLGFLWREVPLFERIARAKVAGFDAVEFHYPYDVTADALAERVAAAGLPVAGINTWPGDERAGELGLCALPGRETEGRAVIDQAVAYATAIRAGYIHVLSGKVTPDERPSARRTFLTALDYAAGQAGPHGVNIVMEPLNRYDAPGYFLRTSEEAAELIAELGRPEVKILFDCYHTQVSEGDLSRRLERLMPIIGHIQIAGAPARAEPDEGEVAYERLLRTIEAFGYRGFIGAEYRARSTVEEGLGWLPAFRAALELRRNGGPAAELNRG